MSLLAGEEKQDRAVPRPAGREGSWACEGCSGALPLCSSTEQVLHG